MWEIIGTALLSGSAGFVAGAYWIVRYKPGPGIDLDEEDHREQWDELRDYCSQDVMLTLDIDKEVRREVSTTPNAAVGSPVAHLVRGGHTECTDKPEPLTVPRLIGLVREAIDSAEASEWEDYMGDDL